MRDQLLQAGLVTKKQAMDAERRAQQAAQSRQAPSARPAIVRPVAATKVARDQALDQRRHEKAQKKALLAQIKQVIEANRLVPAADGDFFNFVDGRKVRRIAVDAVIRRGLICADIVIVRLEGRYSLVPAAIAERIRVWDSTVVIDRAVTGSAAVDDPDVRFAVPDDLVW